MTIAPIQTLDSKDAWDEMEPGKWTAMAFKGEKYSAFNLYAMARSLYLQDPNFSSLSANSRVSGCYPITNYYSQTHLYFAA